MGQHMECLEHEAQLVPAQPGQGVLVQVGIVGAIERQPTAVGPVQPGDEVEQGGLADPRLADDGDVFVRVPGAERCPAARGGR